MTMSAAVQNDVAAPFASGGSGSESTSTKR
jgi:hypothetical protein